MKYQLDKEYNLSYEGISELIDDIINYSTLKNNSKDVHKLSLSVEEYLIRWLDNSNGDNHIRMKIGENFSKTIYSLSLKDKEITPFDENEINSNYVLRYLNVIPSYYYKDNLNLLVFELKKQKNYFFYSLILAIILGIALGLIGTALPATVLEPIAYIVEKLSDTVLGLMTMVAGPLIFFAIFSGITSMGDIEKFNKIGRSTFANYILMDVIFLVSSALISVLLFPLSFGGTEKTDSLTSVTDTVFGIFPANLLNPFLESNFIQILLISVIFAVAAILLKKQYPEIIRFGETANILISKMMTWFCSLIGIVIFATIATSIWNSEVSEIIDIWEVFVIVIALMLVFLIIYIIMVSIRKKMSIKTILKTTMPLIGVSILTGSSTASLQNMIDTSTTVYKNESFFSKFASSLGIVFFAPDSFFILSSITIYCASVSNISISVSWIVTAVLMIYLFSIAAPPVSGGYVALLSIIFSTLAIPARSLTMIAAIVVFLDYICTGLKVGILTLNIALRGEKLKSKKSLKQKTL